MRRALCWLAICMLLAAMGAAVLAHLLPAAGSVSCVLNSSRAALRAGEKMQPDWPDGSIDPNTASAQELEKLRGVGPVLAQRIVLEREQNGPYLYPQDLIVIRGIGEATLMKLWPQLSLPPLKTTNEQE